MNWFKKTKTALFALLMSFISLAQAHAQALPQEKLDAYILKVHQLHHQGTNAVEADKEFTQLTNEIHQHLQQAAASCVREGDLSGAIVHTALIQKLAEAVRDEQTAQEARAATMYLRACEEGRVLEEQLPAQEIVATLLSMSRKELETYVARPQEEPRVLVDITYNETRIRYLQTSRGSIPVIHGPEKDKKIPEEQLIKKVRQQTSQLDTLEQNKIINQLLNELRQH